MLDKVLFHLMEYGEVLFYFQQLFHLIMNSTKIRIKRVSFLHGDQISKIVIC